MRVHVSNSQHETSRCHVLTDFIEPSIPGKNSGVLIARSFRITSSSSAISLSFRSTVVEQQLAIRSYAKMSVTTTDNPITSTLADTLQDYEIRLTGAQDLPAAAQRQDENAPLLSQEQQQQQFPDWVPLTDHAAPVGVENPPDWDTEHRGVPRYRPINYNLNREVRPWGSNPIETAFVLHMFHGVWLTAVSRSFVIRAPVFGRLTNAPWPVHTLGLGEDRRAIQQHVFQVEGGRRVLDYVFQVHYRIGRIGIGNPRINTIILRDFMSSNGLFEILWGADQESSPFVLTVNLGW